MVASLHLDITTSRANIIGKAIGVEAESSPFMEEINVDIQGNTIKMDIDAEELGALRAIVHSYLPWINMGEKLIEEVGRNNI